MQPLQAKLKNVPVDASQVHCSTSSVLNKEEIPSVQDEVLTCNNLEGNPLQRTGGQGLRVTADVCVLSMRRLPLMPTSRRGARKLLRSGKAKIVSQSPFTIQLTVPTGESKQDIVMGVDSGHKMVGLSCRTATAEVMKIETQLETKTKERLAEKLMYRRNRRSKLWYREPRFNNRTRKKGWLPPSILRGYNAHLALIKEVKKFLPISKIIVEVGNFDTQKLDNPEIAGEQYQEGVLFGYSGNANAFVIDREQGKCQFCGKDKGGDHWEFHHIISRKTGSNAASNIALLHRKCHAKIHAQKLEKSIKACKAHKEATFMNVIKDKFQQDLGCEITFGYETFAKRIELGLPKSHTNDAFVIAGGTNQARCANTTQVIQKRKNNRSVQTNRNGFAPAIRKRRYIWQPKNLVWIDGKKYEVVSAHGYGKRVIVKNPKDTRLEAKPDTKLKVKLLDFSVKRIQKHFMYNGLVFQRDVTNNVTEKGLNSSHD